MKIKFSQLRLLAKKSVSLAVTAIILVSVFSGVILFGNDIKTQAATVFDSVNPPSYKELVNEDFTDGTLTANTWLDPYNAAQLSDKGLKLNNPTPNFTVNGTGPSYLSNILWIDSSMETADQHVATEISFSENPASWNSDQYVYLWGRTIMGSGFGGNNRGDHNKAGGGYYLRISTGQNISIDVCKRINGSDIGMMKMCFNGSYYLNNRPGTYRFELNITGGNPTVINARILKKDVGDWRVILTNTCYDASDTQIASGTAGLGMHTKGCANAYIQNFRYITTDTPEDTEETYNYVKKTASDTVGRLFAQVVTLNPAKKYQLSAYTNGLDNSSLERFWVEYYSTAGPSQSGNKQRVVVDVPTVSLVEGIYVAKSKAFCLNEYASSNSAAVAQTSGDSRWSENDTANRSKAIVGFRLDTSQKKTAQFTHFELYEIDSDGNRVGCNLILNPDFKLGLYGWNDNQEKAYTNYITNNVGDNESAKNLVTCYTCSDESEYNSIFKSVSIDMNNTYYKLTVDKKLNITYMGGSVTSGYGASDAESTSWRALTNKWFSENYPDAQINAINAAVGSTGSHFAIYNYGEIPDNKTDLLFIDSAVNDYYLYNNQINGTNNPESVDTYNNTLRNVESLIRNAMTSNPNIDIILVITFDHWRLNNAGNPSAQAMEDLAKKYKLACIDLREPFKKRVAADGLAWNTEAIKPYRTNDDTDNYEQLWLPDAVHPTDAGYKMFADYVAERLSEYLNAAEANSATELINRAPTSETLSATVISNPLVVKSREIPLSTGWTLSTNGFAYIGSIKFGGIYSSAVTTTTPGSTLNFTFEGTDFGLIAETANDCGKIYVEIDGTAYKYNNGIIDLYRSGTTDKRTQIIATDLANEEHTVTIKALAGTGNRVTIGAYYINGKIKSSSEGGGGDNPGGDNPDTEDWLLSGTSKFKNSTLKITGSSAADSYLKNYAFNKAANINQRISVETQVTKGTATANFNPVLWLRADFDDPEDPYTVTGYYAVYSINTSIKIYKRVKDGDNYKDILIGTVAHNNDTRKFRYEFVVEAVGSQTRITAVVSKYAGDGVTFALMSKNTFYDDTVSLQDAGYAGMSLKVTQEQSELTCSLENIEYTTTDSKTDETVYLSKPKEPSANATFGQMLALDPSKTYVFSALVTSDNQKLFIEYNSGSALNNFTRIVTNAGETDTSDGWRRISAEFNINDFVTETDSSAAYVNGGHTDSDGTKLALVMLGFRLNNGKDMAYSELTLYEKEDPLKRNIFSNSDFKMGMYGWCDNMNGTFISHNLGTVDSTSSYSNRVSLVTCNETVYKSLFKVASDEEQEEEFDYENYNGEYMLYCYDESSYNYGKFGQVIELEKGKTYVYSVQYKYVLQKQVAPIALYYKDASMSGSSRKVIKWDTEVKDLDNSTITYTFKVPNDAFLTNNKTKVLIGLTLGEIGGINYFRNFSLYDQGDAAKTNMFTNADFKQGLYGWVHTSDYGTTPEKQKKIYKDTELALVILPLDKALFINDTNDRPWNDGKWYSKFGPDDKAEVIEDVADINDIGNTTDNTENTDEKASSDKQVKQILATRKIYKQGEINVPATIALVGGIVLAAGAAAVGVYFIIIKKIIRSKKSSI